MQPACPHVRAPACSATGGSIDQVGMQISTTMVIACTILFLLAGALLALVARRHYLPLHANPGAPRGSFGWPLVGETLGFLRPHPSNTLGPFLHDHVSRYGAVFRSHLFGAPTVVSCDPELNRLVLQNEERLFQCSYPGSILGILGGSSMITVTGEHHRRLRNLSLALVAYAGLHEPSHSSYLADVDLAARAVVASWRGRTAVTSCHGTREFAFGIMVKLVLGLSLEEPAARSILEDYLTFMKGFVSFPLSMPGTPYTKAVQARRRISCTLASIIEDRKKLGGSSTACFLDVLVSSSDFSHDEKVSFLIDTLLAGHETTSILVSMLIYFIGRSPNCLDQLKREHESIRSSKRNDQEPLGAEDYKKMEYTHNVVNEALRCGNVVKFLHRKALKDVRYKGYLIPSGWKVLPVLSAVHLDPSLHADPQQFRPSRWKELNRKKSAGKRFTPFGGGGRLCPGSEVGKLEAAFFLHHMVLGYRWTADGQDAPTAYPYVEFPRGLPICIEPATRSVTTKSVHGDRILTTRRQ